MSKSHHILVVLFFIADITFPQTDWVKWGKADISYEIQNDYRHRNYSLESENISELIVKSAANAYWFFISDLDGDNCPFRPSCSAFFIESAKETGILQGTLMFFDRFTRDFNLYNRHEHYPRVADGHYYDPVALYKLDKDNIHYIPPGTVVNY